MERYTDRWTGCHAQNMTRTEKQTQTDKVTNEKKALTDGRTSDRQNDGRIEIGRRTK